MNKNRIYINLILIMKFRIRFNCKVCDKRDIEFTVASKVVNVKQERASVFSKDYELAGLKSFYILFLCQASRRF
jgi:hypothetical protein